QVVDRKPDRSAPVRVAAEKPTVRLAGHVVNAVLPAVGVEYVGVVLVDPRYRADAIRRQELALVEQIAKNTLEAPARRDREQAMRAVLVIVVLLARHVLPELRPVLEEPRQTLRETGKAVGDLVVEELDGDERHEADERPYPQRHVMPGCVQLVVVEA